MKLLLDQTKGQMSSLYYLVGLIESETQTEILTLLKDNRANIWKMLHRAKSICSEQGIDDNRVPSTLHTNLSIMDLARHTRRSCLNP